MFRSFMKLPWLRFSFLTGLTLLSANDICLRLSHSDSWPWQVIHAHKPCLEKLRNTWREVHQEVCRWSHQLLRLLAILRSFLHHFADFFLEQVLNVCNFAMIGNLAWDPGPCSRHLSKWRRRRSQSMQAKPSKLQWIWTPPPKKIDEDASIWWSLFLGLLYVLGDEDALQVIEKTLQAQRWHLPQ